MSDAAIRVEGLGKRYRLGRRGPYRTLRESIMGLFRPSNGGPSGEIWALKDVSFEVKPGEVVGVIGRNGAGKSTLLKILSRITEPTEGRAEVRGRVRALLEVGTGFHHELTGRENVYLNGAILGMKRAEIASKFDEIVAFAEIEKFLDTPVKHYSSGMYMRLGFSVAAHLEPEILLVDEVLAVGDAAFQQKCLGKMGDVAKAGRTVLLVSHNMGAVQGLCPRALWIDQGCLRSDSSSKETVARYLESVHDSSATERGFGADEFRISKIVLRDEGGEVVQRIPFGGSLRVDFHFRAPAPVDRPSFNLRIMNSGILFAANMLMDGATPLTLEGEGVVTCIFKGLPLLPGIYTLRGEVRSRNLDIALVEMTDLGSFIVEGTGRELGFKGEFADQQAWGSARAFIPYEWRLPDGRCCSIDIPSRSHAP